MAGFQTDFQNIQHRRHFIGALFFAGLAPHGNQFALFGRRQLHNQRVINPQPRQFETIKRLIDLAIAIIKTARPHDRRQQQPQSQRRQQLTFQKRTRLDQSITDTLFNIHGIVGSYNVVYPRAQRHFMISSVITRIQMRKGV